MKRKWCKKAKKIYAAFITMMLIASSVLLTSCELIPSDESSKVQQDESSGDESSESSPGAEDSEQTVSEHLQVGEDTGNTSKGNASDASEDDEEIYDKEETVHVKADASGKPKEIKVEATLRNPGNGKNILDMSNLSDIKNKEGDEEYTQGSGNIITWENHGEDIRYEGISHDSLPVNVSVSYYLNGKKLSPEEIAGKSGKVKIRFDYTNNSPETVEAGGTEITAHIPMIAVSMMFLPEEHFDNIKAENGRVIKMDEQSAVIGYAAPGLPDDLKLDQFEPTEDIEIPEFFEVTADASDFELDFTATILSGGIFKELEDEDLADLDDMVSDMDELSDASKDLVKGTGDLAKGLKEFKDYLMQYTEGVGAFGGGAGKLASGMKELNDNKDKLYEGAKGLQDGLEKIDSMLSGNAVEETEEETEVHETGVTLSESFEEESTETETGEYEAGDQREGSDFEFGEDIMPEDIDMSDMDTEEMTKLLNMYAGAQAAMAASQAAEDALADYGLSEEQMIAIKGLIAKEAMGSVDLSEPLEGLAEQMEQSQEGYAQLKEGISALAEGSKALTEGIEQYNGGIDQLYKGVKGLSQGAEKLDDAGDKIVSGFDEVIDGANELHDGFAEFDEEGIQELTKMAGNDLADLLNRIRALKQIDTDYTNFSGIPDGRKGSVRFIIETDEVKK